VRSLFSLALAAAAAWPAGSSAATKPLPPRRQGSSARPLGHPVGKASPRQAPESTIAPAPDANEPDGARILKLQDALRGLLHAGALARARVGVEVLLAGKGRLLFSHNADRMFDPASNEKILTTATALARLGPEFRYRTAMFGPAPDEDGVVAGDIYLRGSGDPSLATADLVDLAGALVRSGVRRVTGGVLVDERAFDRQSGAPVDTNDTHDELGFAAITLNHNTFSVRVRPTEPGSPPEVVVDPPSDYLVVKNRAATVAGGRSRIQVTTQPQSESTVVQVTGRLPAGHAPVVVYRRPLHPALFAGATLLQILRDLGVEVARGAHAGKVPGGEVALAAHESPPLAVIIRKSNKDSNNFVAERIFQTVGAELFGAPATAAKGRRAIQEYLTQVGLRPGTFEPQNGSGLAHTNRITPDALVRLLLRLYYDLSIAPDFLQSLSVAGIDGTIRRRFAGSDAVGLVRAKTGTLNGVSCLSGYVGHKEDVLVFSVLVQGFRQRKLYDVRRAQVSMVHAMLHYLRGTEDRATGETEMDIESTDETVDTPQDPEPPSPDPSAAKPAQKPEPPANPSPTQKPAPKP
jgi:D-alanyl-D-alanine carboxypeptidase/D-alanyl-D-alanine-endopeptidase (penicillin-binding protein 4)